MKIFQSVITKGLLLLILLLATKQVFYFLYSDISLQSLLFAVLEIVLFAGVVTLIVCGTSFLFYKLHLYKVGEWGSNLLFSLVVISECYLEIYTYNTNLLLGSDLFLRSISDCVIAINGFIPLWLSIAITMIALLAIPISFYLVGQIKGKSIVIFFLLVIFVIGIFPHSNTKCETIQEENFTTIKLFHLLADTEPNDAYKDVLVDEEKLNQFISLHPEWQIEDYHYPFERKLQETCALSSFFCDFKQKPNIIIIVEESLGREWAGNKVNGTSYTPFFDSLAETGLYWENCMSISPRSFSVVPAVLGSVPYGNKGFQYGIMPETNGIIPILKSNGYKTEVFYGGDISFDYVYDYLENQHIDYISHYEKDLKNDKSRRKEVFSWGYHDSTMFAKGLLHIQSDKTQMPYLRLFVTLTGHDRLSNSSLFQKHKNHRYYSWADSIITRTKNTIVKKEDLAPMLYADDCLRYFIGEYSKRDDFQNTIFIITGDHSSGKNCKNDLSLHHVPMVIWSPLIKQHVKFQSIVSHNDVAPTIIALLKDKINLHCGNIHFIGSEFDTSKKFQSQQQMPMLNVTHDYDELLFGNYFFKKSKNQLYEVSESLELIPVCDTSQINNMMSKLELMTYIHQYCYQNNCVTQKSIFRVPKYRLLESIQIDSVQTVIQKPSVKQDIFSIPIKLPKNTKRIKVVIQSDINTNRIQKEDWSQFHLTCKNSKDQKIMYFESSIYFFIDRNFHNNNANHFYVEKTIDVQEQEMVISLSSTYISKEQEINDYYIWKNCMVNVFEEK